MSYRLERLRPDHPVEAFQCGPRPGADAIERFLREQAAVEQAAGWSATTVAVDPVADAPGDRIVGFYTLSPLSLRVDVGVLQHLGLAAGYPVVGGYLLGRLGVAASRQGQGLGALLVERVIDAACRARQHTGGAFLAVDAKNERLVGWYLELGYGFERLSPDRPRLVLRLPFGVG